MATVHQLLASFSPRDAVGNHALLVRRALQAAGHESELYAESVSPGVAVPVRSTRDLPGDGWVIYQMSIGSVASEWYRRRRGQRILNYHNITPAEHFSAWEPQVVAEIELGRQQLAEMASCTDHAIAVSEFNRRELDDLGYPSTSVVPVLTDLSRLDPSSTPRWRQALDVAATATARRHRGAAHVLFVGRVVPHKGFHDLIKALALYRSTYDGKPIHLDLVGTEGSAAYAVALQSMLEIGGLGADVTFHRSVGDEKLAALYDRAELFCCLSEHEGFGVPLIEAMVHDVPVVALASSGVTDTVGYGGLLLPHKDPELVAAAWHRVIVDDGLRQRLVEAGRARAEDFSLDRTSAAFVRTVEECIAAAATG